VSEKKPIITLESHIHEVNRLKREIERLEERMETELVISYIGWIIGVPLLIVMIWIIRS